MFYILCWCGVCFFVWVSVTICHHPIFSQFLVFSTLPQFFFFNFFPIFVNFFQFPYHFFNFSPNFFSISSQGTMKNQPRTMKSHESPPGTKNLLCLLCWCGVCVSCFVITHFFHDGWRMTKQVQSELSARGTKRDVENTYRRMYLPDLYPSPTIKSRSATRRAA